MDPILRIIDLHKQYPKVTAVNGISLDIRPGICFGLLGPNGAGKTTTIEMMEGLRAPTSGQILYRGEPMSGQFKAELGIQFQTTALPDFLTVREALSLFRSFYAHAANWEEVIELCSLREILSRYTRKLSGGQRQRVLLAIALVNDPQLLFLDEPTTGLDPQARRNFWDLIEGIKQRQKTIVLTTHYMEEAHVLCDEIAIMDKGKVIAQGDPEDLLHDTFKGIRIRIPKDDWPAKPPALAAQVGKTAGHVEITTTQANQTMQELVAARVPLENMEVQKPSLEDLFLELTGKGLKE